MTISIFIVFALPNLCIFILFPLPPTLLLELQTWKPVLCCLWCRVFRGLCFLQLMPKRLNASCYSPPWACRRVCKASLVPYTTTYVNTDPDVSAVIHWYRISWIMQSIVRFTIYLASGFREELSILKPQNHTKKLLLNKRIF
jgi:hypothetical protein